MIPIELLEGHRPDIDTLKQLEYRPEMPFNLNERLEDTDPNVFFDFIHLFILVFCVGMALLTIFVW